MSKDTTSSPECAHHAREDHVMRGIVRSLVTNMEGVLSDLQGIMGDIQSLVVQIDHVTEKMDKNSDRTGRNISAHWVQKPRCLHGCSFDEAESKVSHCDSDMESLDYLKEKHGISEETVNSHLLSHIHKKANCCQRPKSTDVHNLLGKHDVTDKLTFAASKSFHNFSKSKVGMVTSPSGGIAIVHPTIFKKKDVSDDPTNKLQSLCYSTHAEGTNLDTHAVVQCLPVLTHNLSPGKQHISRVQRYKECKQPQKDDEQKESVNDKNQWKMKHTVTSVYNKSFQAVTPTEQLSPKSAPKNVHNCKAYSDVASMAMDAHLPRTSAIISQDIQDRLGRSLPSSPQLSRPMSHVPQGSSPNSPQMKRSSLRAIYSKIDGQTPSTMGKSLGSVRVQQPSFHHYYHSIESDLDSELAITECPGTRSMTPDIDWSYLNLVGNDRRPALTTDKWRGHLKATDPDSDGYEVPITSKPPLAPKTFQMLQTSPDVVAQLPLFSFRDSSSAIQRSYDHLAQKSTNFDILLENSLTKHVFCSEISNGKANFYCGCYEAIVDSVLENLAGYETLEEACADFDNEVIAYDSYISFDEEFEEDDWDMGLRPEDNEDYNTELPFFYNTNFYGTEVTELTGHNDIAQITTYPSFNLDICEKNKPKNAPFYFYLESSSEKSSESSERNLKKSCGLQDDVHDDMEIPSTSGNSFTDEDCCVLKPQPSQGHSNFILWPKNSDVDLGKNIPHSNVLTESQMTSSDDASCQAVWSGSPMSFSSPEAPFTSPDTDRFMTSSEGDDLFTSQEEGYFQSCDLANSPVNEQLVTNRPPANLRPREFLQSLYIFCQQKEQEMTSTSETSKPNESSTLFDSTVQKVDKIKDNLSDTGSYTEDLGSYNRAVNTWTAYALVHMQSEEVSDSDILNDNNMTSSMSASYINADNIGASSGNQTISY